MSDLPMNQEDHPAHNMPDTKYRELGTSIEYMRTPEEIYKEGSNPSASSRFKSSKFEDEHTDDLMPSRVDQAIRRMK